MSCGYSSVAQGSQKALVQGCVQARQGIGVGLPGLAGGPYSRSQLSNEAGGAAPVNRAGRPRSPPPKSPPAHPDGFASTSSPRAAQSSTPSSSRTALNPRARRSFTASTARTQYGPRQ